VEFASLYDDMVHGDKGEEGGYTRGYTTCKHSEADGEEGGKGEAIGEWEDGQERRGQRQQQQQARSMPGFWTGVQGGGGVGGGGGGDIIDTRDNSYGQHFGRRGCIEEEVTHRSRGEHENGQEEGQGQGQVFHGMAGGACTTTVEPAGAGAAAGVEARAYLTYAPPSTDDGGGTSYAGAAIAARGSPPRAPRDREGTSPLYRYRGVCYGLRFRV
jgi:hypothetical protein